MRIAKIIMAGALASALIAPAGTAFAATAANPASKLAVATPLTAKQLRAYGIKDKSSSQQNSGGFRSFITNPLVIAGIVATAIAVPVALANSHHASP